MLELPKNCVVDSFIPKKTFYERVNISTTLKQEFINKLEKIIWKYKISQDNLNIAKTDEVEEIEIFELFLKEKCDVKNIIKVITISIPYPIVIEIKYDNEYRYAIKYENDIIQSEWNENIKLSINGLDLKLELYFKYIYLCTYYEGRKQLIVNYTLLKDFIAYISEYANNV